MSWVQENKFLAGLAGVTVVGAGVLGYLVLQASSNNAQARATYEEKSAELNRLQTLTPFPSSENVKKLDEQRAKHAEAIKQLQQNLSKIELPLEDISQLQFQDRLRATVDALNQSASQNGVKRAEGFNLGFDRYLSEPPRPEASAPLARQLKAIEILVQGLIANRVAELRELKREELPAEKGTPAAEPAAKGGKPSAGDKGGDTLVTGSTVEIAFLADQGSFKQILNGIISNKEQFYIPRLVTVVNEKQEPPSRTVAAAPAFAPAAFPDPAAEAAPGVDPAAQPQPGVDPAAPAVDPSAAPAQPGAFPEPPLPGAGMKTIIVGDERIEVKMRIEIVDFAEPPTTASK